MPELPDLRAMPQRLNDRSRAVVDSALDRVFAEPYAVATPEEFERLMVEHHGSHGPGALASAGAIAAFVRSSTPIAERALKYARVGSNAAGKTPFVGAKAVKYAVMAIPVALSLTSSARRGVHELQVLASFLIERFRQEGIEPDRGLVRALTIAITLDPDRRVQLDSLTSKSNGGRAGAGRIGAGLGGQWIFRSIGNDSTSAVRKRAERQLDAVERLDLRDLSQRWTERPR
jgi:hypothetical protein